MNCDRTKRLLKKKEKERRGLICKIQKMLGLVYAGVSKGGIDFFFFFWVFPCSVSANALCLLFVKIKE